MIIDMININMMNTSIIITNIMNTNYNNICIDYSYLYTRYY